MRRRGLNKSSLLFGRSLLCAQWVLLEKWKFENLEFGDFFGGGEVEENLLIGVKKRSIINSKKNNK